MGRVAVVVLALALTLAMGLAAFFNAENVTLKEQIEDYRQELSVLKTANLTTALGIKEIPPDPNAAYWENGNSHVWITGYVFNCGGSIAYQAGLQVIARAEDDSVLMNVSLPLVNGGIFSANENKSLIPEYFTPTEHMFGNVLSQQNVTVRMSIYHEGSFSNSTKYEITPFWTNPS